MNSNKLFLFLLILLTYFYIFYLKLDDLERYTVFQYGYYFHNWKWDISFKDILETFLKLVVTPFKEKMYLSKATEGSVYGSYILQYLPKYATFLNDKLFWYKTFKEENITHPETICYIKNKKLNIIKPIINNKKYLCKPLNGGLGYKIYIIKGYEIKQKYKQMNNTIIQELLNDCIVENARHFRLVTLQNGEIFNLYEIINKKNKLVSNNSSSYDATFCINGCDHLSFNEQLELNKINEKLKILHQNKFPMIFSFGWDIMIDCTDNNSIRAVSLEGNIMHSAWKPYQKNIENLIIDYKTKYKKFLIQNNYYFE